MKVHAGTSGFSYKEWKGPFYPEKIKNAEMLAFYAGELPAVEINNTFYRMPRAEVLERWAEEVPKDFRFVLKASRRITHFQRLKGTDDSLDYLLEVSAVLQARRGPILFQLPPNMKKDSERLKNFVESLPGNAKAAFEFRHESWFDDEVTEILRAADAALCVADNEDSEAPATLSTASFGYLRLRRADYDDEALTGWLGRAREQGWSEAYVFFKHEDDGAGPRMAKRFLELAKEDA